MNPLDTYWYLASAYAKHPDGMEVAFLGACLAAGQLIKAKVPVFSPIAHSHPISQAYGLDPGNHDIWLPADQPMIDAAHGCIVLRDRGWQDSKGIAYEVACFRDAGKPVIYMDPGVLPAELRPGASEASLSRHLDGA